MPPISIKFPASMKNGIAASVYLSIDVNKCWPTTSMETLSLSPIPTMLAKPIDIAMGTDKTKQQSMTIRMMLDIRVSPDVFNYSTRSEERRDGKEVDITLKICWSRDTKKKK